MERTAMTLGEILNLIFTDYTIRTVAIGAAILGVVSGALSSFAVLRRLGDTMSHAALPGVVIAFILTGQKDSLPLFIGAAVAGWLGTLLVLVITTQTRIKEDSALGIVLAVFFGFGLALLSWLQHQDAANQSGLDKFLFGRAAALIQDDVILMGVISLAVMVLLGAFWKEFKLLSFDPDYGGTLGFPMRRLDVLLTTLIVVAVVVGLQMVGVVLMSAMLVAPGAAARQWTDKLSRMVVLSAFFGALAGVAGALMSSLTTGLPTGPMIVLCISAIVVFSLLFAPNRGLVWDWVRQQRNRQKLRTTLVLEALYEMGMHHGDPRHPHSLRSLQAVLPRHDVAATLKHLEGNKLVEHKSDDLWALTPEGMVVTRTMFTETRGDDLISQDSAQIIPIREGAK
jgi:manganese/zinc/iron transport system permease protein